MYCTYKLTMAALKMFIRNKPALFFSLFVPLMIMLIFGAMDFDKQTPITFALVTHQPGTAAAELIKGIKESKAVTIEEGTREEEKLRLDAGKCAAMVEVPDDLITNPKAELTVSYNESKPVEAAMARAMVRQFTDQATLMLSGTPPAFVVVEKSVSRKYRYIEFLMPGIVAMAVMQMSIFSVAFVFAQYREKGVLKRVLATPVKPYQFVTANIVTRLFMSVAQSAILIVVGLLLFHVQVQGSIWLLGLCVVAGALMFLGLGFTISGMARSMDTVPVVANLIVFPMMFLGNIFFPAGNMPWWLQPIAANLPLTYFSQVLRGVMTNGEGLEKVQGPFLGLLVWMVVLVTLAMFTFRLQEREG
jgi:ABC-2 type transport system permease protein